MRCRSAFLTPPLFVVWWSRYGFQRSDAVLHLVHCFLLFPRLLGCCMSWTPLCWTFSGQVRRIWFDVVIHHREDGGFQLVSFPSLAKSIPSLHSGSSVCVFLLVSLLTLWCLQPFWRRSRVCFSHPYPCLAGFCRLSMLPCSILRTSWKNVREGSGHPVSPLSKQSFFEREGCRQGGC